MSSTLPLKHKAGGISVWHPETLDVDALFKRFGQRVGEGVLWLGHCVLTGLADDARYRDAGWVPLKTEYLRNVIGRHHLDDVRRVALEVGYVERDRSYYAGKRSQDYRILLPYYDVRLTRKQISNSGLRHNIRKWYELRRTEMWRRIRGNETPVDATVCEHLWQNLQRVQIDAKVDFGDAFRPSHQIAVEHIREREFRFTVDDYGRIHTNLTNLPKVLRRHLSVEGKRMMNIDISESQPLFMGMAIAKSTRRTTTDKGTKSDKQARRANGRQGTHHHHHMLDNTMLDNRPQDWGRFDRRRLPADLQHYLELCETRGLYQAVAGRLEISRNAAKRRVMVVFFDKPWHRNKVAVVLDELFPSVMREMRRMKRGNYGRLAHFAQRIESSFMFGRVIPRIIELRPDLFIGTIHDSILTIPEDGPFVRQVMLDEFARLGLRPQVQVEECSGRGMKETSND